MHAGAALFPFLVPLHAFLTLALVGVVLLSLHRAWRRHLGTRRVTDAVWRADGSWELKTADGHTHDAGLAPQAYVSAYAVVLRFELERGGTRALVILPDSLDGESFRRLRVRLRLEAAMPHADRQPVH